VRRGRDAIEFYVAAFDACVLYKVGGTEENLEVVSELGIGDAHPRTRRPAVLSC
jgi:PhnB protein